MARRKRIEGRDEWPTTIVGCLRTARRLLWYAWDPNQLAADHRGFACEPGEPYACRWSISGAVQSVRHNELVAVATVETIAIALAETHSGSLIGWETDPRRTPQDIQALLIRAEQHVRKAQHPHPPKDITR